MMLPITCGSTRIKGLLTPVLTHKMGHMPILAASFLVMSFPHPVLVSTPSLPSPPAHPHLAPTDWCWCHSSGCWCMATAACHLWRHLAVQNGRSHFVTAIKHAYVRFKDASCPLAVASVSSPLHAAPDTHQNYKQKM